MKPIRTGRRCRKYRQPPGVQSYQNSDNAMIIITHHSKDSGIYSSDFVHLLIDVGALDYQLAMSILQRLWSETALMPFSTNRPRGGGNSGV